MQFFACTYRLTFFVAVLVQRFFYSGGGHVGQFFGQFVQTGRAATTGRYVLDFFV